MLELFQYDFVRNAFLAGGMVAIVSGLIGYFVVLRGQTFACEALSHTGFTGATAAALLGVSPLAGMFFFTVLAALGMGLLGKRLRNRDVEVGMVLAFMLGLGVLFLSLITQNATTAVSILFGSILSVTNSDVLVTVGAGLLSLFLLAGMFRPLLFASFDPDVAETRGVPVQGLSVLFLLLLAMSVSEAMQVVGVLLVFALLVVPAATAEHLTHRPLTAIVLSVVISLVCTWGGLVLAFIGHWPASFYIVSLTSLFYFISLGIRAARSPHRYHEPSHPSREVFPDVHQ
ncbi:MAG: metal ABC transporter permease [Anaerolineales bacterium]